MSDQSRVNWEKGDVAMIKDGWHRSGTIFEVLGPAVFTKQWWVPVLDSGGDPDFFKEAGLDRIEPKEDLSEYIPKSLRKTETEIVSVFFQRKEVMYAIGQLDGDTGIGMWDGPNPDEHEMLEVEGRDKSSVIVRFNLDGTDDMIWKWREDRWECIEGTV